MPAKKKGKKGTKRKADEDLGPSKKKVKGGTAWHCAVDECSFPHLHITSSHQCGSCEEFGHGQIECGDDDAIDALATRKLPKSLHCSLPECGYSSGHVEGGHRCGECGGFGHSAPQCDGGKKPKTKKKTTKAKKGKKASTSSEEGGRFYNEVARTRGFAEDVARDKHGNVAGALGDLGKDGAFEEWSLLIFNRVPFGNAAQKALRKKGWELTMVSTESACVKEMKKDIYDVVMVISQGARAAPHKSFLPLIKSHHERGKGLLIAADNEPLYAEANAILTPMFKIELMGNTPGDKTLTPGDPSEAGHFDAEDHLITAGIDAAIYEGVTICYPRKLPAKKWTVFGMSSDAHPVLISTSDTFAGGPGKPGRVVIDCGFTKFYDGYFEKGAATDRYLSNAMTWLANVEAFDEPAKERGS